MKKPLVDNHVLISYAVNCIFKFGPENACDDDFDYVAGQVRQDPYGQGGEERQFHLCREPDCTEQVADEGTEYHTDSSEGEPARKMVDKVSGDNRYKNIPDQIPAGRSGKFTEASAEPRENRKSDSTEQQINE